MPAPEYAVLPVTEQETIVTFEAETKIPPPLPVCVPTVLEKTVQETMMTIEEDNM